jgi:hypothetical protein
LIGLIFSLLELNQSEENIINLNNNFTNTEKDYIPSNVVSLGMIADYYTFSFKENDKIIGFCTSIFKTPLVCLQKIMNFLYIKTDLQVNYLLILDYILVNYGLL